MEIPHVCIAVPYLFPLKPPLKKRWFSRHGHDFQVLPRAGDEAVVVPQLKTKMGSVVDGKNTLVVLW
jgi:hypothetical protein